ncbi:hypothetical protein E1A91_D09G233800v1 [Gossypium mustelinum]|uniref:UDP-glycosyltransferases domain-containing protein n=1 Tax=Gossypium mustelinum TaxID=34275 RepID=A0A5D2TNA5_GOSMU|nr:hypothetical protein E1A91_D09G233800v1 [Gossypium mustelinum]
MTNFSNGVHVLMIPFPASGHIFPLMDLAHQILLRGLTVTIMVTPKNLHYLNSLLSLHSSSNLQTLVLPFPSHSSIPHGVENMQDVDISFVPDFAAALTSRLGVPNVCFVVTNAHAVSSWWVNDLDSMPDCYRKLHLGCIQSWGLVFNSFNEIDNQKLKLIKEELTEHDRLWAVGPLLPIKGRLSSIGEEQYQVMSWLDSCKKVDKSVVYVAFGTQITLTKQQMEAVASALEESMVRFIWVVKEPMKGLGIVDDDDRNVVPPGFEDRVAERGVVIKGWAPQLAILGHPAVGSYLTHCGWNSALEGIFAGVLLLAWPMQADHFHNTALLVDELGVAVRVCEGLESVPDASKLARTLSGSLTMNMPERIRTKKLRKTALDSITEGGSSYKALDGFVEQLSSLSNREEK